MGCVNGLFTIYFTNMVNNFGFDKTAGRDPSLISQHETRFEIFPISLADVSTYLMHLGLIKAKGLDDVSSFFFKELVSHHNIAGSISILLL